MPELPEVETVRRGLDRRLTGRRLTHVAVNRPDLRFPLPPDLGARLTGRRVEAMRRRAKYLLYDLDNGETLIGHLGMSGRMHIHDARPNSQQPHEHIVFTVDDGTVQVQLDQLRAQAHHVASLLREAVVVTDLRGSITQFPGSASRLASWTEADALGQPLERVLRIEEPDGQMLDWRAEGPLAGQSIPLRRERVAVLSCCQCYRNWR